MDFQNIIIEQDPEDVIGYTLSLFNQSCAARLGVPRQYPIAIAQSELVYLLNHSEKREVFGRPFQISEIGNMPLIESMVLAIPEIRDNLTRG